MAYVLLLTNAKLATVLQSLLRIVPPGGITKITFTNLKNSPQNKNTCTF